MKRTLMLLVAIFTLLFASGCSFSPQTTVENLNPMRKVAASVLADIYVVNIDGKDYIVVLGTYKAAVCPK